MPNAPVSSKPAANRIELFAARIQRLPPEVRWLYAQQELILALAGGSAPRRGPRTAIADRVAKIAMALGVARGAAAGVSLILSFVLYLAQHLVPKAAKPDGILFVGIGAMRESSLVPYFERRQGRRAIVVNETDFRTLYEYRRIPLARIVAEWVAIWREIWTDLGGESTGCGVDRHYRLSQAMLHGHRFVYFRAWFKDHLSYAPSPVIGFSAASYVAYAAVAARAAASYLVHGFQKHSVVFPDFAEVHCFNRPEADHFRKRLPQARVTILAEAKALTETRRLAAIASVYAHEPEMSRCKSFIVWARERGLPVLVRRHPQDRSGYWEGWRETDGVTVDDRRMDFETFMKDRRPRILASWGSTTLCDAVAMGAVPVIFAQPGGDLDDFVFPLGELALKWPEDRPTLEAMVDNPAACAEFARAKHAQLIEPEPQFAPAG